MTLLARPAWWVALGLALLGAVALFLTRDFPWGVPASADAALVPRVASFGLLGLGLVVAALEAVGSRRSRSEGRDADQVPQADVPGDHRPAGLEDDGRDARAVGLMVVLVLVWSQAAFRLGFIVSTTVFVVAASLLLGRARDGRSLLVTLGFALALAIATSYGFFDLLGVRQPDTVLP